MDDRQKYEESVLRQERAWEETCIRCGSCCGAFEDPCEHLRTDSEGTFFCDIYADRFGLRRTLGGKEFRCVPIRTIMHLHWSHDWLCVYKQKPLATWTDISESSPGPENK